MKLQQKCADPSFFNQGRRTTLALQATKRIISGLAFGLSVCLLTSSKVEAAQFSFTKVVDTNTPIPGGTGNFANFLSPPTLDNGNVVFIASPIVDIAALPPFQQGIYTNLDGSLNVVADGNTPIPGGTGNFAFFTSSSTSSPSLDNGSVAFFGFGITVFPGGAISFSQEGIYTNLGGSVNVVADRNTPIPGGTGNFAFFGQPTLDNGSIAFAASIFSSVPEGLDQEGIYISREGSLSVVADRNTPFPGGNIANFERFSNPSLDNESVAFGREGGVYINLGGSLNLIANSNTPIPGGTGNFTNFNDFGFVSPSLNNGSVAFIGSRFVSGEPFQEGIYTNLGGSLNVVADFNTPIPSGTGNFNNFDVVSLNDGNIAFVGGPSTAFIPRDIYTTLGGTLTKVIDRNDSLDGKTINFLLFSSEGLSGNQIAFLAGFTDNSQGIYIATLDPTSIPESSTTLGVLAIGACGASSMLRHKYKKAKLAIW